MKKLLVLIALLALVGFGAYAWRAPKQAAAPAPAPTATTSANESPAALHDRVVVDSPKSGESVQKKFTIAGKAPGNWFFEASFPIKVVDADNNPIGSGIASALSDWMTTADVPFKADISIAGYTGPATIVLLRDNPSGLPENDDSFSVPIVIR